MQELEKELVAVADIKDTEYGCVRCGMCCANVPIRSFDIKKVEKATGLKAHEFSEYSPIHKRMMLKMKKDPTNGINYCMFLKRLSDGTTSCELGEDRPWTCKMYPFGDICLNRRVVQKGLQAIVARVLGYFVF